VIQQKDVVPFSSLCTIELGEMSAYIIRAIGEQHQYRSCQPKIV